LKHLIFSLVLSAGLAGAARAQNCNLRLSGHVHSTATHENLSGATVLLVERNRRLVTDPNGDFRFDSLCAGTYRLLITHTSFDTIWRKVELQRSQHTDVDLAPLTRELKTVTVAAARQQPPAALRRELSGRALEETRGLSLGEAAARLNGVTQLMTGTGISKPVVHGLHSNRLLTINNGVRQEGQQWGNEHAPEIDTFIAGNITVVKGGEELRYGSDAIGGAVVVEPRPLRNEPGSQAELHSVYFTNNRQYVVSGIFEQQLRRLPSFTWRVQGTFGRAANATTPDYRLNNTGFGEQNFSLTARWRREHFGSELYYSLFSKEVGIFTGAHIGNLADLRNAIAQGHPDPVHTGQQSYAIGRPRQEMEHHLLKSRTWFDAGKSRFNVLLALQTNNRREFDVVRNAAASGAQIDLSVSTFSQEVNWEHPRKGALSGTWGLTAIQQDNRYSGRYLIPNYRSFSYGVYVLEKWADGPWDLQGGLRFDRKDLHTRRLQTASQVLTEYGFDFSTVAATLNTGYKLLPAWRIYAGASLSTRAPHVNELLTNGIHHGTGTYEIGDISLRPERSLLLTLGQSFFSKDRKFQGEISVYRNRINNFIYQQPRPNDPVLTIRGAFPLLTYQATDALLQGMDMTLAYQPFDRFRVEGRYSMLRARNLRTGDWLILMPADRLQQELTYNLRDFRGLTATSISFQAQQVARQNRVPDERNGAQDYAPPPPAYALFHANAGTTFRVGRYPITFSVTARNLFNQSYREYLNAFRYYTDEPGRNIIFRLRIGFQKQPVQSNR